MNWDLIFKGVTLLIVSVNSIATLWMFLRRRNDQRITALGARQDQFDESLDVQKSKVACETADRKEQVAELRQNLALAQQSIRNMPTHQDLQKISERLGNLEANVEGIDTKTDGITNTVNTIRDLLMEKGL